MSALAAVAPSRPVADGVAQEFSFGAADFERVRTLIYQRAGISLHAGKQAMVYSRLSRRLRDGGFNSFGQYLQALERSTGPAGELEWQEFINCLTTNLTSFFREEHHFPVLHTELVARKDRDLRIWCNAASTGEEPYSLAMTVVEALGPNARCKIICSDIDTKVLATAEAGVYAADARGQKELRREAKLRRLCRRARRRCRRIRVSRRDGARLDDVADSRGRRQHRVLGSPGCARIRSGIRWGGLSGLVRDDGPLREERGVGPGPRAGQVARRPRSRGAAAA